MSLLEMVRQSGGAFGMAVGRGENDEIVDVQVAATGETAKELVAVLERLQVEWGMAGPKGDPMRDPDSTKATP